MHPGSIPGEASNRPRPLANAVITSLFNASSIEVKETLAINSRLTCLCDLHLVFPWRHPTIPNAFEAPARGPLFLVGARHLAAHTPCTRR